MNDQEIISQLIKIGEIIESGSCPQKHLLETLVPYNHINATRGLEMWQIETANLSNSEIAALLIGITYVERELKWYGGSAAGAIWIFRIFVSRNIPTEYLA